MTLSTVPRLHPLAKAGYMHGMGANPLASAVSRLASQASGAVRSVTLRSNISPDITLDPRQASGVDESGRLLPGRRGMFSEALLRFAKPEILVDTPAGVIRVAPYGRPTTNLFWPVMILGTAGGVALGILVFKSLSKKRRRRAA